MADEATSGKVKSCRNCPSYLKTDEAAEFFGKSIGAPMCAQYGHVLGAPNLLPVAANTICQKRAESCDKYGDKRPVSPPEFLQTGVAQPDPTVVAQGFSSDEEKARVTSCSNCAFYVEPSTTYNEVGWPAGLCSATGRLLIPTRLSKEASNCDWRRPGEPRKDVDGIVRLPMFEEAFEYDPSPLKAWKKSRDNFVDPWDYEPDFPAEPGDEEYGIVGYRKVVDQAGTGNIARLPLFDPESFTEYEREIIPRSGDDEHPEWYIDTENLAYTMAVLWMEADYVPATIGPPGVGKTELFRYMAWLMRLPFRRINIHRNSEVEDLIGKMVFENNETKYVWGRVTTAWNSRTVLVVDEPNAGDDAVWQALRPLMDNSKQLVLDANKGELIDRNPWCFLGLAMNPSWDHRNVGVNETADADKSRYSPVYMDLPDEDVEREILLQWCQYDGWTPADEQMEKVLQVAEKVRELSNQGVLPITWGIRSQIKAIRFLRWFDPITAYKRAGADDLEKGQRDMVLDFVRASFGIGDAGGAF